MTIHQYIKDLLLFNEKVVLPGLGAIESERVPSSIDAGKITPPYTKLSFNMGESMDDKLLQNAVTSGEEITGEEAAQRIQEFIDEIRFSLNKSEPFEIKGIGFLEYDDDNMIRIRKSDDFEGNLDSFGLDSFVLEEGKNEGMEDWKNGGVEEEGESVSEKGDEEENGGPDEEEITDKEDITEEEKVVGPKEKTDKDDKEDIKEGEDRETEQSGTGVQKEEEWPKDKEEEFILPPESEGPELETADDRVDDTKTESVGEKEIKKSNRNTLWIISGAIFVILTGFVLLSLFTDVFSNRIDIDGIFGSPDEDIEINDDFSGEEFEFDRMVDEMEDEIDSATRMENALDPGVSGEESESAVAPVETAPAANTTADYHIIAGSFRSESNAGELQQQLTLQGYTPLIIELDNGIYRVSAISFSDKATALRELIGFREKTGIESAWLMNLD